MAIPSTQSRRLPAEILKKLSTPKIIVAKRRRRPLPIARLMYMIDLGAL
jgi:hypothetical protein